MAPQGRASVRHRPGMLPALRVGSCSNSLLPFACPAPPARPHRPAEGLIDFLVKEKTFAEDRIRKAVERINAAKGKASQGRLESFFGPAKVVSSTMGKRKEVPVAAKGKKGSSGAAPKKGKLGGMGKKK